MIKNINKLNNPAINSILSNLSGHIGEYKNSFCTSTSDSGRLPEFYIEGLIKTERGKRNMERLHEELDMDGDGYQQIQQFITNSTWDASGLIRRVAQD
ncbi:MAG: transposase, partial [Desulfamplus sp.]|nr:transposase [Desulfamplus sp.]